MFFYFKKLMLNSMQDLKSWVDLLRNYWDFILWSNLAPPLKFHWHINSLIDPIKIVPQRFHRFTDRHCRYLVDVEFDGRHRWWRIHNWRYKCKVVMICEYLMLLPQFTWNDQSVVTYVTKYWLKFNLEVDRLHFLTLSYEK